MSIWRQLKHGLRGLANRRAADQDVADEVQSFLDEKVADLVERGASAEHARRVAFVEAGNPAVMREEVRSYGWENTLGQVFSEVRFALRRLRQRPGFTAAAILTLALGIGSTAAIFSVINGVLLKPLPYPESERIVSLLHRAPGLNIDQLNMSPSLYFTYLEQSRVFQNVSLWAESTSSITGLAEPEEVPVLVATHQFLPGLGVQPSLGRGFTAEDDKASSEPTVMLSDGYWKARFGGNPSAIGKRIVIDGEAHEIIGVLPASFEFMDKKASMLYPIRFERSAVTLYNFGYRGVAKLKPGVTLDQANADVARMFPITRDSFAPNPGMSVQTWDSSRMAPALKSLRDDLVGDAGNALWVLMGTVGIVLMIACANVANLFLVRAEGRQQELAVRAALGAGWGRIVRELLVESVLLGVIGGAFGLALAHMALRALAASGLSHLPRAGNIAIDGNVLAFTLVTSIVCGLLFGMIPAFKYARPQVATHLRGSGGRSASASKERRQARGLLVVVQVALALVLLVGAGLMIRTVQGLRRVDPGFSGASVVQMLRISIPESQAKEPERVVRMEEAILRKMEGITGVTAVGITNTMPMDGGSNDAIYAQDREDLDQKPAAIRRYKYVSPGYVSALGSRLIAGREFTWEESYAAKPAAMVSENLARELWRDPRLALGKRIRANRKDDWVEVVGVIADLRDHGIDQAPPKIAYWPLMAKNFSGAAVRVRRNVAFAIRTPRAGSTSLLAELRQAVATVNPDLPLARVMTLQASYEEALARTSFTLALSAIAGGMALILGVIGIYGVIAYLVAERTREIGIRMALGAPAQGVMTMFVRYGLRLSGIGAACGLAVALLLTRLMKSVLYDVSPADPLTYAAAAAGLILAAILASYLPARRAASVDPILALRSE